MSFELVQLMVRAESGCRNAAAQIVERYGDFLRRHIRRQLSPNARAAGDSEDVLQEVWKDFFAIAHDDSTFASEEKLIALLRKMAQLRVLEAERNELGTQKRCRDRVDRLPIDVRERRPTPEQLAVAEDEWRELLRLFPPNCQRALELLRAGHSQVEVAQTLGLSQRSVSRLVQLARQAWAARRPAAPGPGGSPLDEPVA